ncbi:MAG: hypothetical protein KDK23_01815 [Leptospiraceae bacterium]|nr:hypothetical protein [Leptospiraceae bacterium]
MPLALRLQAPQTKKYNFSPEERISIEGRNGLRIVLHPNSLEIPEHCHTLDAYFTDYVNPLETVAANLDFLEAEQERISEGNTDSESDSSAFAENPTKQKDAKEIEQEVSKTPGPSLLESAGMFDLRIYCGQEEVHLKKGQNLLVSPPRTVPGEEFGTYVRTEDGWKQEGRQKPSRNSYIFRGKVKLQQENAGGIRVLDMDEGFVQFSSPTANYSLRLEPGQKRRVLFAAPQHIPEEMVFQSSGDPGIRRVEDISLASIPEAAKGDSLVAISRSDIPPELFTERCRILVQVIRSDSGMPQAGAGRLFLNGAPEVSANGRFCLSEAILGESTDITIGLDRQDSSGETNRGYRIQQEDRGKLVILSSKRSQERTGGGEIVISENSSGPGDPSADSRQDAGLATIPRTGMWNFDYPRFDLACLTIPVRGAVSGYMATVLSLDRFSAYTQYQHSPGASLNTAFLQGERSRVLVFSLDQKSYGVSSDFLVWNKYGHFKIQDSPCQVIAEIQLKPLPEYALSDPKRFRKDLGL